MSVTVDPRALKAAPFGRGAPDLGSVRRTEPRDLVELYAARIRACGVDTWSPDDASCADESGPPVPTAIGRGSSAHRPPAAGTPQATNSRTATATPTAGRTRRRSMPRVGIRRRIVTTALAASMLGVGLAGDAFAQQRYRVQPGDTVESVAAEFGVDANAILAASYVADPPNLQAGEVIVIPDPGQSPAEAAAAAVAAEGTSPWVSGVYYVQPGDTIESIAAIYGVTPGAIAELNALANPDLLDIGQRLLIPDPSDGMTRISPANVLPAPDSAVWVPAYAQERNLSCEYAAAFIATSSFGAGIPENVFIENIPVTRNPHFGYRGDIDGAWGNYDDYGIYPEPLVPILNDYGFAGEIFYSGGDTSLLVAHIDAGHPVVTWLALWGDTGLDFDDEESYTVYAGAHVVVVYGYNADGVFVADPGTGAYAFYTWDTFTGWWSVVDGMSLAVYPF